jgi:hypothetical protein
VKLPLLLEKIKQHPEIKTVETTYPDGIKAYTFSAVLPFPKIQDHVWYVIIVKPGQEDVDDREVVAMLRHLWMLQTDIVPDDPDRDDPDGQDA